MFEFRSSMLIFSRYLNGTLETLCIALVQGFNDSLQARFRDWLRRLDQYLVNNATTAYHQLPETSGQKILIPQLGNIIMEAGNSPEVVESIAGHMFRCACATSLLPNYLPNYLPSASPPNLQLIWPWWRSYFCGNYPLLLPHFCHDW